MAMRALIAFLASIVFIVGVAHGEPAVGLEGDIEGIAGGGLQFVPRRARL